MVPIGRLRPSRTAVGAAVGLAWALSAGAARRFVWADVRENLLDLRWARPPVRLLAWTGVSLIVAGAVAILLNDLPRAAFDLVPLSSSTLRTAGRGSLVPGPVVPLTIFLLALGWTYALAGAVRARPAIAIPVAVLYLLSALGWWTGDTALAMVARGAAGAGHAAPVAFGAALAVAAVAALPLFRRARPRPGLEFALLLALVAGSLLLAQARQLESQRLLGSPVLLATLEAEISALQGLVLPFLFLIGIDIAIFTERVSTWAAGIATVGARAAWAPALLLLALAARGWTIAGEAVERVAATGRADALLAYAGALAVPLLVAAAWIAVRRLAREDPTADGLVAALARWGPLLVVLFVAVQLVTLVLVLAALALPGFPALRPVQSALAVAGGAVNAAATAPWQLAVQLGAVVAAVPVARRGRVDLALYLALFGLLGLWAEATAPGRPLAALGWRGPDPEDLWWTLALAALAAGWLAARRLDPRRATLLLALVAMTWLLRQTALLDDPYSPFFLGYSGIGFVAFGVLWDVVTVGAWANEESDGAPRASRVFLYLGYALIVVAVVHWAVASHDLATVSGFTGDAMIGALDRYGRPMLYAVFATTVVAAARGTTRGGPAVEGNPGAGGS